LTLSRWIVNDRQAFLELVGNPKDGETPVTISPIVGGAAG
jgi:hypothetical protein